jgi:peptidoglycan-N-acetylglucosamine deacetylase
LENSFAKYIERKNQDIMQKHTGATVYLSLAITKIMTLTVLLSAFFFFTYAQDKAVWHNKKCAVVLTYDDALNVHLDNVIPILDSLGFKGTFYLSGFFPSFRERITNRISVAKKGHELGNHTLFHPCEGKAQGREWVKPDYDLNTYTIQRIVDEISMANTLLEAMDGKTKRTFAYPCGDMKASDSSYVDQIKKTFAGARGVGGKMQKLNEIDLYNIGSYLINGQSGDKLINLVKKAIENNSLLVFLFHGVGGEHSLNVSLSDHRKLLYFLKQNEKDIWVTPLIDVVEYIRSCKIVKP